MCFESHADSECVCWGLLPHTVKQRKTVNADKHAKLGVPNCGPLNRLATDESQQMTSGRATNTAQK